MAGIDKTTGRTVAVIVLLVLTAAALRGYLPDTPRTPREPDSGGPATLFAVSAMLAASLVIVAIAIVARLREKGTAAAPAVGLRETLGGGVRLPKWRLLLIGLGALIVWLAVILLLARLGTSPTDIGENTVPDDGSAATTHTEAPDRTPPPPPAQPEPDEDVLGYRLAFVVTAVAFLAMVATGTVVARRHQRHVTPVPGFLGDGDQAPVPTSGPEPLMRAAELGLAEMGDVRRDPREAIIACYAAMEHALADAPGVVPLDSDTPSEVLARAVEHHALRTDSATQLVDLFTEARFSPHVMNEQHREIAVRVLRRVLADLGSTV